LVSDEKGEVNLRPGDLWGVAGVRDFSARVTIGSGREIVFLVPGNVIEAERVILLDIGSIGGSIVFRSSSSAGVVPVGIRYTNPVAPVRAWSEPGSTIHRFEVGIGEEFTVPVDAGVELAWHIDLEGVLVPEETRLSVGVGETKVVDLPSIGGYTISGQVVAANGESLEKHPIVLELWQTGLDGVASPIEEGWGIVTIGGLFSNSSSKFEFPAVPYGFYDLRIRGLGAAFGIAQVSAGASNLMLDVPKRRTIHLTVRDPAGELIPEFQGVFFASDSHASAVVRGGECELVGWALPDAEFRVSADGYEAILLRLPKELPDAGVIEVSATAVVAGNN